MAEKATPGNDSRTLRFRSSLALLTHLPSFTQEPPKELLPDDEQYDVLKLANFVSFLLVRSYGEQFAVGFIRKPNSTGCKMIVVRYADEGVENEVMIEPGAWDESRNGPYYHLLPALHSPPCTPEIHARNLAGFFRSYYSFSYHKKHRRPAADCIRDYSTLSSLDIIYKRWERIQRYIEEFSSLTEEQIHHTFVNSGADTSDISVPPVKCYDQELSTYGLSNIWTWHKSFVVLFRTTYKALVCLISYRFQMTSVTSSSSPSADELEGLTTLLKQYHERAGTLHYVTCVHQAFPQHLLYLSGPFNGLMQKQEEERLEEGFPPIVVLDDDMEDEPLHHNCFLNLLKHYSEWKESIGILSLLAKGEIEQLVKNVTVEFISRSGNDKPLEMEPWRDTVEATGLADKEVTEIIKKLLSAEPGFQYPVLRNNSKQRYHPGQLLALRLHTEDEKNTHNRPLIFPSIGLSTTPCAVTGIYLEAFNSMRIMAERQPIFYFTPPQRKYRMLELPPSTPWNIREDVVNKISKVLLNRICSFTRAMVKVKRVLKRGKGFVLEDEWLGLRKYDEGGAMGGGILNCVDEDEDEEAIDLDGMGGILNQLQMREEESGGFGSGDQMDGVLNRVGPGETEVDEDEDGLGIDRSMGVKAGWF